MIEKLTNCPQCGKELIVHNQIRSDMIVNPYNASIIFECTNCMTYKKYAFDILRLYKKKDELGDEKFDDYLAELEDIVYEKYKKECKNDRTT